MAEVQERRKKTVEASMTEQVHLIMQQHLNGGGRLFGGALMQWLDEVAGVVAMRHAETYRVVLPRWTIFSSSMRSMRVRS